MVLRKEHGQTETYFSNLQDRNINLDHTELLRKQNAIVCPGTEHSFHIMPSLPSGFFLGALGRTS